MRNLLLLFLALTAASQLSAADYEADAFTGYISRYKDVAIKEMERTGIPASIKLAQGLLESDAGRSELAVRANNHFGIKCGNDWVGDTHYKEDDDYDDKGKLTQSCFRRYKSADASFVAHSEFLLDPRKTFRYGFLFRLDPTDYKEWARGLKQAGYATNPRYPQLLIDLIERYQLHQYDQKSNIDLDRPEEIITEEIVKDEDNQVLKPATPVPTGIQKNNDVKYVAADGQLTLEEIARRVDVSVRTLINYNEFTTDQPQLEAGDKVYLQPKRSSYRGKATYHQIQSGESMFSVSQQYGVRLSKLYQRNLLQSGQEPAVGERIKLRGSKLERAPRLRGKETPKPQPPATTVPSQPVTPSTPATDEEEPWRMDEDNPIAPEPVRPSPSTGQSGNDVVWPTMPADSNGAPTTSRPSTPPPPPVTNQPVFDEPAPQPQPVAQPSYHTVQKGDTLYNISRRYNVAVTDLRRLNNLTADTIRLGQQLRVQ